MAKIKNFSDEKKRQKYSYQKEGEWLTEEICKAYREKAKGLPQNSGQDTAEWRKLRIELQKLCDITEIEAVNILRGLNIRDYVNKYDILSGKKSVENADKSGRTAAALERLAELETRLQMEREDIQD